MMTTPEAIRHRQLRLAIAVTILGVLTVVWGVVLEAQAVSQRHCLQTSMVRMNSSLTVRAELNDQRNEAITAKAELTDEQVASQHTLIKAVSVATTEEQVTRAFAVFNRTDAGLARESQEITKKVAKLNHKLKSTPVPPFPEGRCN